MTVTLDRFGLMSISHHVASHVCIQPRRGVSVTDQQYADAAHAHNGFIPIYTVEVLGTVPGPDSPHHNKR